MSAYSCCVHPCVESGADHGESWMMDAKLSDGWGAPIILLEAVPTAWQSWVGSLRGMSTPSLAGA